jgi:hypothetical protein
VTQQAQITASSPKPLSPQSHLCSRLLPDM